MCSGFNVARARVLQIVESTTAGVKSHVLSLLRHLDRDRFALAVACPQVRTGAYGDTSFLEDVKVCGVPYHIVDLHRAVHPFYDLRATIQLHQVIRRGGFQIVHTHSSKGGLLGRLAARVAGVPGILYTPNGFAFRGQRGWRRWLYLWAERLATPWTDVIICSSEGERVLVLREKIARPRQLTVVENAIDPQQFTAWTGSSDSNTNGPVIGTITRLVAGKGLHTFLRAAALFSKIYGTAQFVVVGDGDLRGELERLTRDLGIMEQVNFLGFRNDVHPVLDGFDVFVLPTEYEAGVPFAVLEAMAMGRPVITTNAQGLERLRGSGAARLVPVGDVEALVRAIQELWHDPTERLRLGQAGRALVEAEYDIADKVRHVEALYEGLLRRS